MRIKIQPNRFEEYHNTTSNMFSNICNFNSNDIVLEKKTLKKVFVYIKFTLLLTTQHILNFMITKCHRVKYKI